MTPEQDRDALLDILDNLLITHYRTMSQTRFGELWDEAKILVEAVKVRTGVVPQ